MKPTDITLTFNQLAKAENALAVNARVCLKIHFRHLHIPLCGIFDPNSVNVAHYAALIRAKSPTK